MKTQIELLIDILFDESESTDVRDDAAIYLGDHDENEAIQALLRFAHKDFKVPQGDLAIKYTCGESIGNIWLRQGIFDRDVYNQLSTEAKQEIRNLFKLRRPDLLDEQ
jgi:HEAT repeat protein